MRKKVAPAMLKQKTISRTRIRAKEKSPADSSAVNRPASNAPAEVAPPLCSDYRARVRMYRQGLGDCFLVTFPRKGMRPFNILIDCGALSRSKEFMTKIVEHIEKTVAGEKNEKGRLDIVVATHEHQDHLSGFNQARDVFNRLDIGGVWLAWTENLNTIDARKLKKAKKAARANLTTALQSQYGKTAALENVRSLQGFTEEDDTAGTRKIEEAVEYLKLRGKNAGLLRFLEPGEGPFTLDGVEDVRVYVLGPPRDVNFLKTSSVTDDMKRGSVIYQLSHTGVEGMEALSAALSSSSNVSTDDQYHPFAAQHRIYRGDKWFKSIKPFVDATYDDPGQSWRRIDEDWLSAFGQLALDLDNDTNNTSLVLAFEFIKSREVLLFVGDAQVGNWQSWSQVSFKVPDAGEPMPAHDLLKRTVFYKVGHHCSHNATAKVQGLELMESDALVAFIPLDKKTAKSKGRKDSNGNSAGWDMPAAPLFKRLLEKAKERVVISDVNEVVSPVAISAGVNSDDIYIDYILK